MTEFKKVFMDTAPLIYFFDNDENFGEKTLHIFEELISDKKEIIFSTISCMEYLVMPYRTENIEQQEVLFDFIKRYKIDICSITLEISKKAARIRAQYPNFKAMDSIQLAAAVYSGCDVFLTNDIQLKQFKEIKCILVNEWQRHITMPESASPLL